MTRGNHEIHSQQGAQGQEIKLALGNLVLFFEPFLGKEEHQERSRAHQSLDYRSHRRVHVHAPESMVGRGRQQGDGDLHHKEQAGYRLERLPRLGRGKQIVKQQYQYQCHQRNLVTHQQETGEIHISKN